MSGHTAGPWTISRHCSTLVIAERRTIATTGGEQSNIDREQVDAENQANARLVAAAPELLVACKAALPLLIEKANDNDPAAGYMSLELEAAIAKAEGRTP